VGMLVGDCETPFGAFLVPGVWREREEKDALAFERERSRALGVEEEG